jgi:DNA-binding response OmpR family regulator
MGWRVVCEGESSKMRILVVDDEKKVASFIKRGLAEEQHEVHTATDGEECLKLTSEKSFDLILLDWMLPKMDGLSVLKDIRARKIMTPILMLTAKDSIEDIVAGLESGSDDYLTKPFVFPVLLARVRALLRRSEHSRGAELKFVDLRLDPIKHKVWRKDEEINLSVKEYGLLEYFMRNPNRVLTRTMIAENVWDNVFEQFTNIIDVYINYLRNKIGHDTDRKLIHTVRGAGYVFKEEK